VSNALKQMTGHGTNGMVLEDVSAKDIYHHNVMKNEKLSDQ
jgi:hypothetical protein